MQTKQNINLTIPFIGLLVILILSLSSFTTPKDGKVRYRKGFKQEYDAKHKLWIGSWYDYKNKL